MDGHFAEMLKRLKLTKAQRSDAKIKYTGVAKKLYDSYYGYEHNGNTKLLIGSYGKKTNIKPPGDVDLLFKIPQETYEKYDAYGFNSNGPAALLQDVRETLNEKYTTTDVVKAWGKVVLVSFKDGTHDVELLPAYETGGIFIIPNSEDGGSWERIDVRGEIDTLNAQNAANGGQTKKLVRIMKCWKQQNTTIPLKSYDIEQYCLGFLNNVKDLELLSTGEIVHEFLAWLRSKQSSGELLSFVETACGRAEKALIYESDDKPKEACGEWIKVFGKQVFPAYSESLEKVNILSKQYPADAEEYIEDQHHVRLNPEFLLKIKTKVNPKRKGFRDIHWSYHDFIRRFSSIPHSTYLYFQISTDIEGAVYKWKIRNFGEDARQDGGLRGQIKEGDSKGTWFEHTKYHGTHYVECYAIVNDVCVAIARHLIPISTDLAGEHEN